jgi:2-keto-4-pentenoate hydratase
MLLLSPATLPVNFGAQGLIEADLLVRIGDSGINDVANPEAVLQHLDAVIPFVELPDPLWSIPLTASRLVVANCGARYGVMGDPVLLDSGGRWRQRLSEVRVDLYGPDEHLIASGAANTLMGDPLGVVFWLVQRLRSDGVVLKVGDLLSLGSLTRPLAPEPGRYRADYRGLYEGGDGQRVATVSVEFTASESRR